MECSILAGELPGNQFKAGCRMIALVESLWRGTPQATAAAGKTPNQRFHLTTLTLSFFLQFCLLLQLFFFSEVLLVSVSGR